MDNNMIKERKNYEINFLARSEEGKKRIIEILEKHQLSVINEGKISKIKLAFPIKKENFAYFGYFYFSGEPQVLKNLSDQLKTDSEILRFLIINQPTENKGKVIEETSLEQKRHLSENHQDREDASQLPKKMSEVEPRPARGSGGAGLLSNEALEKKLEEILR